MNKLPSVTQVLGPWQDFSRVPEDVLTAAQERGKKVHGYCAAYALGVWAPALPEELRGYRDSFLAWFNPYVTMVVKVEPELVSNKLGYRGHPDLICQIKGDSFLSIVDYKTPLSAMKAWGPQCAAYRRLVLDELDVRRNLSLRLRPDGNPALVTEYSGNYHFDLGIFLNALAVWRYFNG